MFNKQRLISILSIIIGTIFIILGLLSAGAYVKTVIDSLGEADKSLIFWYFVLLQIGIFLLVFGIFFITIGRRSLRGDVSAYNLVKRSLIGLAIFLIILIIWGIINNFKSEEFKMQREGMQETENYLNEGMQRINLTGIQDNDENGFYLLVKTTGGLEGIYNLQISITGRITFLEISEPINFDSNVQTIRKRVDYTNLFKKCFNELKESDHVPGVCVEGGGTSGGSFKINTKLILIEDAEKKVKNLDNTLHGYNLEKDDYIFQSNSQTIFFIDTLTEDGKVIVEKFQLEPIQLEPIEY
jgi:hypothetical protein|tara:strand:- start:51 stop:944 length:894 start_codon:yes stop_codon:yes gene_type:complete